MRRGSRLSRRRRRGEEERRGGEEQATDIKSNNPHLAGGEITRGYQSILIIPMEDCLIINQIYDLILVF